MRIMISSACCEAYFFVYHRKHSGRHVPSADRQFRRSVRHGSGGRIVDADVAFLAWEQGNIIIAVISGENSRSGCRIHECELDLEGCDLALIL